MKTRFKPKGYTLVEVVAASVIIGVGLAAATSLSSTVMLQEELSWRVAVALNYQENATKLFQLGINPAVAAGSGPEVSIYDLMPRNPVMDDILVKTGDNYFTASSVASATVPLAGDMERASTSATIRNFSSSPTAGSTTVQEALRPTLR